MGCNTVTVSLAAVHVMIGYTAGVLTEAGTQECTVCSITTGLRSSSIQGDKAAGTQRHHIQRTLGLKPHPDLVGPAHQGKPVNRGKASGTQRHHSKRTLGLEPHHDLVGPAHQGKPVHVAL